MQDFIIVASNPTAFRRAEEQLRNRKVVARISPHLIEGRFEPEDLRTLPPGVEAFSGPVPARVLHGLPAMVQLAAKAMTRARTAQNVVGDGLAWDAPGFEPPK